MKINPSSDTSRIRGRSLANRTTMAPNARELSWASSSIKLSIDPLKQNPGPKHAKSESNSAESRLSSLILLPNSQKLCRLVSPAKEPLSILVILLFPS